MKVKDYISKSIQEYPSLYKSSTYEDSKLLVMNHVFFTNGNGVEFAQTEKPEEGGYCVDPKHKKVKGEWERKIDKPYGKEKSKKIPAGYFDDVIYYVGSMDGLKETIVHKGEFGYKVYYRTAKTAEKRTLFNTPMLIEAEASYKFHPYPFSKGFCLACDLYYGNGEFFLQPDWMEELINLVKRALQFYTTEEEYKEDSYYPDEQKNKSDLKSFEENFKRDGAKGIKYLRKIWSYEISEETPTMDEVRRHNVISFDDYRERQIKFLNDFLNKYERKA
jgi:hypothetical protein